MRARLLCGQKSEPEFQQFSNHEHSENSQSERVTGVQVYPEEHDRKRPPQKAAIVLGAIKNQQPQADQQPGQGLWPNSPRGRLGEGSPHCAECGNVWSLGAAQIQQEEGCGGDGGKNQNESRPSPRAIEAIEKQFRQPLVRYPRLAGPSVGKRVSLWNSLVRDDVLPGLEMPPKIGIRNVARRHCRQSEKQDCEENLPCTDETSHKYSSNRVRKMLIVPPMAVSR